MTVKVYTFEGNDSKIHKIEVTWKIAPYRYLITLDRNSSIHPHAQIHSYVPFQVSQRCSQGASKWYLMAGEPGMIVDGNIELAIGQYGTLQVN